ncbi:hypothetical protein AB0A71_24185 [Kitasatospora aureofaciens]
MDTATTVRRLLAWDGAWKWLIWVPPDPVWAAAGPSKVFPATAP